jgi:hypothetical protein
VPKAEDGRGDGRGVCGGVSRADGGHGAWGWQHVSTDVTTAITTTAVIQAVLGGV